MEATEAQVTHIAEPLNVTDRIRRRVLRRDFKNYYGAGKSILLELPDPDPSTPPTEVNPGDIVVCDLTDWINLPANHKVAIDPVLGRIAFADAQTEPPLASFYYGFSAPTGGGEYNRLGAFNTRRTEVLDNQGAPIVKYVVNSYIEDPPPDVKSTISDGLSNLSPKGGAVEILNSGRYAESLTINAQGKRVVVRAADKCRPTLVLSGDFEITGEKDDEIILDGLLIAGGRVKVHR